MLISVGILAWNEEEVLEATLVSLFQQSVFQDTAGDFSNVEWEIIVVPNGCNDGTATVAHRILADMTDQSGKKNITFAVHELKEPGKSNAWNHYIHEFSDQHADLILMIDADIEFGEAETISNTVKALWQNPHAMVAVDLPLKDVIKKPKKTLVEWISATASSSLTATFPSIAGSFFCARGNVLRQIWMPKGLAVEDGFLSAMIVTDCFRSPYDEGRIIRAENATHFYETLTSLRTIFRHELRLVIGTTLNCYFIWDFLMYATDPTGSGAGVLIRNWTEKDPSWYPRFINNSIKNHGFWVLPRGMLFRRFSGYKNKRGLDLVKWTPIAIVGFLLDLPIFFAANRRIKNGNVVGFW
jgi:glycosyltransferase involved in cell wall biosynthesis